MDRVRDDSYIGGSPPMTPTTPLPTDAFAEELRKYWAFDDNQQHTHSWHTREDFIAQNLPKLLADYVQRLSPQVGEDVVDRAKVLEAIGDPGKAPCGCESCYCGNFDDAAREGAWREQKATHDKILALPAAHLLSSPREVDCPQCGGQGFYLVSGCCQNPRSTGECCGNPVPEQEACQFCGGGGKLPAPSREDEMRLGKRPVAFRVKDLADDWILFHDEAAANREAEYTGAIMQGLYVRDGATLASTPSSPATGPKEIELEPGWLARDVERASARVKELESGSPSTDGAKLEAMREAVLKFAKKMRKSNTLQGPREYQSDPKAMRVWQKALYHEGKDLEELVCALPASILEGKLK